MIFGQGVYRVYWKTEVERDSLEDYLKILVSFVRFCCTYGRMLVYHSYFGFMRTASIFWNSIFRLNDGIL
ncbi:unnamed protein product [Moneuplotes crassus]|uniref:Uncharacterized protein n=1 Tax=Euplotes crassus TaxID=5936 RepID=A0AAD1XLN2_EUPCR|nr:unnamed protein product [Moneuplotes crassus]